MTITLYFIPIFKKIYIPEIFESHHMYLSYKKNLEMLYFNCIIIIQIEIQICKPPCYIIIDILPSIFQNIKYTKEHIQKKIC